MRLSVPAILLGMASAIGVPIGIGGGIFLAEFGRGTKLGQCRALHRRRAQRRALHRDGPGRLLADRYCRRSHFSALAGGVALGIMMIPTVCRTTEEMLLMVPHAVREAALGAGRSQLALGAVHHREDRLAGHHHRLHAGLCARGRRDGAAASSPPWAIPFWSTNLNQPIAALPLQIYVYAQSPYDDWHRLAWAGALVLIVLIVVAVSLVRFVTSRGVLKGAS